MHLTASVSSVLSLCLGYFRGFFLSFFFFTDFRISTYLRSIFISILWISLALKPLLYNQLFNFD